MPCLGRTQHDSIRVRCSKSEPLGVTAMSKCAMSKRRRTLRGSATTAPALAAVRRWSHRWNTPSSAMTKTGWHLRHGTPISGGRTWPRLPINKRISTNSFGKVAILCYSCLDLWWFLTVYAANLFGWSEAHLSLVQITSPATCSNVAFLDVIWCVKGQFFCRSVRNVHNQRIERLEMIGIDIWIGYINESIEIYWNRLRNRLKSS